MDVVFDCVGLQKTFEMGLANVAAGGGLLTRGCVLSLKLTYLTRNLLTHRTRDHGRPRLAHNHLPFDPDRAPRNRHPMLLLVRLFLV